MGLGVEPITGKPYKPTTQGKNERFQTLFRYLDKQTLAESLAQLQAQVDAFDHIYNTERPYQGLPGRVTPLVITNDNTITVTDLDGEVLIEHNRPAPGVTYVGNGKPRGPHPKTPEPSPKS